VESTRSQASIRLVSAIASSGGSSDSLAIRARGVRGLQVPRADGVRLGEPACAAGQRIELLDEP